MRTKVTNVDFEAAEEAPYKAELEVINVQEDEIEIIEGILDIDVTITEILTGREKVKIAEKTRKEAEEKLEEKKVELNKLVRKVRYEKAEVLEWLSKQESGTE